MRRTAAPSAARPNAGARATAHTRGRELPTPAIVAPCHTRPHVQLACGACLSNPRQQKELTSRAAGHRQLLSTGCKGQRRPAWQDGIYRWSGAKDVRVADPPDRWRSPPCSGSSCFRRRKRRRAAALAKIAREA